MHYGFGIPPALVDNVGFLGRAIGENDVTMAALKGEDDDVQRHGCREGGDARLLVVRSGR